MNLFFMICATKINVVFFLIFAGAGLGFTLLSSALWALAEGALDAGAKLLVVSMTVCGVLYLSGSLMTCSSGHWFSLVLYGYSRLVYAFGTTSWSDGI